MTNATLHRSPIKNLFFASTSSFAWQLARPNLWARERLGEILSAGTFSRASKAPRFGQKQVCNSGYIWAWVKAEAEFVEKTGCICPPSTLFSVLPNPALPRHLLQPFMHNRAGKFTAVWPRRLQTVREVVEESRAEHTIVLLYPLSKEDHLAHFHFAWLLGWAEGHQANTRPSQNQIYTSTTKSWRVVAIPPISNTKLLKSQLT